MVLKGLVFYLNAPEAKLAVKRSRAWFKAASRGEGEVYSHPRECFEEGYAQGVFDTKKCLAIKQVKEKEARG